MRTLAEVESEVKSSRRWPDFLIIGAYKSGTSALHHALQQHPQLFLPRKEVNYFAFADGAGAHRPIPHGSVLTEKNYRKLFDAAPADALVGDSSPEYMANPSACPRIAATIPDARLIAVLRNPIERAYSDFMMYRRDGYERCERFSDALDKQEARAARRDPTGYYVSTGFYAAQLRPYFDLFPREQMHILLHEDLRENEPHALAGVFEFLGVDPSFTPPNREPVNASGVPATRTAAAALLVRRRLRGVLRPLLPDAVKLSVNRLVERSLARPALEDADRTRLAELYRSDITDLGRMLGRDLSHWLDR